MSHTNYAVPSSARPPERFWTDFGNFVMASYNFPPDADEAESDAYWSTLCKWADILMNRYNNKAANAVVFDYLNSQSDRNKRQEEKNWRAHYENEAGSN